MASEQKDKLFQSNKKWILAAVTVVIACAAIFFVVMGMRARGRQRELSLLLETGSRYLAELDYEQAVAAFKMAVEIEPKCEEAYLGLADAYVGLGDLDLAAETLAEGYARTASEAISAKMEEVGILQAQAGQTGGGSFGAGDDGQDGTDAGDDGQGGTGAGDDGQDGTGAGNDGQGGFSDLADFQIENGALVQYLGSGGEVWIPDGVTWIGDGAFANCSSLTSVYIPDGVTGIDNGAFADCSSLANVYIPDGVTWIGDGAFIRCFSLTSVYIPDGVGWIGVAAFDGCSSLTSVFIPDSVTDIGESVFIDCSSLETAYIPKRLLFRETDGAPYNVSIFGAYDENGNVVIPASLTVNLYTTPPPRVDDRPARPAKPER